LAIFSVTGAAAPPALLLADSPPLHPTASMATVTATPAIMKPARPFLERMINSSH
jgi:hypothetical protein